MLLFLTTIGESAIWTTYELGVLPVVTDVLYEIVEEKRVLNSAEFVNVVSGVKVNVGEKTEELLAVVGKSLLVRNHMDKERIKTKDGVIVEEKWESNFLTQVITYEYNNDNKIAEEKIIQLNKVTEEKKVMLANYQYNGDQILAKIVMIENNNIEIEEFIYGN